LADAIILVGANFCPGTTELVVNNEMIGIPGVDFVAVLSDTVIEIPLGFAEMPLGKLAFSLRNPQANPSSSSVQLLQVEPRRYTPGPIAALPDSDGAQWGPEMCLDSIGNVYVAWIEPAKGIFYAKSSDGGQSWGLPQGIEVSYSDLPDHSGYHTFDIAADEQGQIYLAWVDRELERVLFSYYDVTEQRWRGKKASTTYEQLVDNYPFYTSHIQVEVIDVGSDNAQLVKEVLVTHANLHGKPTYGIGVSHWQGSDWVVREVTAPPEGIEEGPLDLAFDHTASVSATNPVFMVWKGETNQFNYYDGQAWQQQTTVPCMPDDSSRPGIGVDPRNHTAHILFSGWDQDQGFLGIYHTAYHLDGTWENCSDVRTGHTDIALDGWHPLPHIAVNERGDLLSVWRQETIVSATPVLNVFYAYNSSQAWLPQEGHPLGPLAQNIAQVGHAEPLQQVLATTDSGFLVCFKKSSTIYCGRIELVGG